MEIISRTGCGIITNQGAYPDRKAEGKAYLRQLALNDDKYIPALAKVAEMINRHGAVSIQQILHGGRYGGIELDYCVQPTGKKQSLRHFRPPKEMNKAEIKECVREHAQAARRATQAGFHGVEITSFMGYLLSNFNSKFTNTRTDEYGGSVENRGRFMVEVIESIKEAIGDDRPVIVRLNGVELMDEYGGNTPEECLEFMKMAELAGADCISLVIGWHESRTGALGRDVPTDHWLHLAEAAKKFVEVPVAFGPRFGDPFLAERALADGAMDFWEVCRPLLADPDLVHKIREARTGEIRPCVGGLLCLSRMFRNLPYICAVNPQLGHEYEPEYHVKPAVAQKKVMVVGAGPGGLECAITAAKRGHRVTVYDRKPQAGGQLLSARREVEGGEVFLKLVEYYKSQIVKWRVTLILNTEVTPKLCDAERPDVVVVATGAELSPIRWNAGRRARLISTFDILENDADTGEKIVVLGGDRMSLVAAESLAAQGKAVTIVEERERIGWDVIPTWKWRHDKWINDLSVRVYAGCRIEEVGAAGVRFTSKEGAESFVDADTIVYGGPRRAQQELLGLLEFGVDEIYVIGDAVRPRSLHNAIHEGFKLGARI
jgi:2,4-dienoyl-CoA reductase (NADPH2)